MSSFPIARHILFLALAAMVASCDADKKPGKKNPLTDEKAMPSAPARTSLTPTDLSSQSIEKLTSAHTRIVWSQYQKPNSAEPYSNNESHFLMGLDTRDGQGARPILAIKGNYSRPLLTTDGMSILYTDKQLTRGEVKKIKHYDPVIHLTNWQGETPKKIAKGYAVDTWKDTATGIEWVYAVIDLVASDRIAIEAKKLIRFPLSDPSKKEIIWDQTAVSPDNIQLSRDGTRASGQFPWPNSGQFLLGESPDFQKYLTGCWTALAPDNSQISWVLDGEHREATCFADDGAKSWTLSLVNDKELSKGAIYHPRWTNHPQFITLTGPYLKDVDPSGGSAVGKGGSTADVYIGKLNEKADAVEAWVCVDQNALGDAYPDVWIEGGDEAVMTHFPQKIRTHTSSPQSSTPPTSNSSGLVFQWEDRNQKNTVKLANHTQLDCSLETRGAARYGRRLDMLLDSGNFQPKSEASAAISSVLSGNRPASLSFLLSLENVKTPGQGVIAVFPELKVQIQNNKLEVTSFTASASLPLPSGSPIRVVINKAAGGTLSLVTRSGSETQQATSITVPTSQMGAETSFGGGGIAGSLRDISIYDRELAPEEIQSASAGGPADSTPAPPRVRLRGKLTEISPMPTEEGINPYTSAMVSYIYDVISVSEGEYPEKQILVKHWGMLTKQIAAGFPRTVGEEFDLIVEPLSAHPELKGDRSMELDVFDLVPYYDITTPSVNP